jgi:hypothetical protein
MSLSSMDRNSGSAAAEGAAAGGERVPLLRAGGYAAWKPKMDRFLMSHAGGVHRKVRAVESWKSLSSDVEAWGDESLEAALAAAGSKAAKVEQEKKEDASKQITPEVKAARATATMYVERSIKAYNYLMNALDVDVALQVAHLENGWAYGLWMWLERKYQSTEPDNIATLLRRWMDLKQGEGEFFDLYRARVNEVHTLLKVAGQEQSPEMYCFVLIDKLESRYAPAVMALHNGDKLKDKKNVDWEDVTAMINAHERKERQFAEAAASGAKAMAARGMSSDAASSGSHMRGRSPVPVQRNRESRGEAAKDESKRAFIPMEERQCYNCSKFGHLSFFCPKKKGSAQYREKNEEQVRAVTAQATVQGKQCAYAVKSEEGKNHPSSTDEDGWTRVGRKHHASTNQKMNQERAVAAKPAVDTGGRRLGATPATSVVPVRGNQQTVEAAAHPRPREVIKNGVNASVPESSCAEASTLTVSAVTSTAAPSVPSGLCKQVAVVSKGIMKKNRKKGKMKEDKKSVSFSGDTSSSHRTSAGLTSDARANAVSVASCQFGLDSMASLHIVGNKGLFVKGLRSCKPFPCTVANGEVVPISHVGSVELHINVAPGRTVTYVIDDVFYHPQIDQNLLSLHWLTKKGGWQYLSNKDETSVVTPDGLKVHLRTDTRVSLLPCHQSGDEQQRVYSIGEASWDSAADLVRLHERLGHMGFDRMLRIIKASSTHGIGRLNTSVAVLKEARGRVLECKACKQGKGTRTAFGQRGLDKGSAPAETLHMDTYYIKYNRADGTPCVEYGLTMSCSHTTFKCGGRVGSKDLIAAKVIAIVRIIQSQFGCTVKRLRTDGGGEFINHTLLNFCAKEGIALHWPPARTPKLNSVAERQVRSCKDAARTLLMHAGLPGRFGPRAIDHAIFLWNRTNVAPITGITPYEAMLKRKPSVEHVSVFGCDVFYHLPREQRDTFDAKMAPGIYLGHNDERGSAIVYDMQSGQEVVTRDVEYLPQKFTHATQLVAAGEQLTGEDNFEFTTPVVETPLESEPFDVDRILDKRERNGRVEYHVKWLNFDESEATWEPAENVEETARESIDEFEARQLAAQLDAGPQPASPAVPAQEAPDASVAGPAATTPPVQPVEAAVAIPVAAPVAVESTVRRSARRGGHPSSASVDAGQQHVHMARSILCSTLPGGDDRLSDSDAQLVCAVASGLALLEADTPATYKQAMQSEQATLWRKATDKEMAGCEAMGVWELVPRTSVPKWQIIIACKWVFKVKTDSSGAIDVYKARITPKGFLQREGINFFETFAATGKYKSLRLGLMVTAACGHNLEQMDVPQAFLNADVDEEVYMEVPEGYRAGKEHLVCRLKKALYGLKQAPRNWYLLISKFVADDLGYQATVSDPCLFFRRSKTGRLMLLFLFVDDFQTSYHPEDKAEWDALKAKLVDRFKTKDLGASTWILGMRITRDLKARTITLDQELYVTKALERHGMDQCKPVATPGVMGGAAAEAASTDKVDVQRYQEMVGTLMYSAVSCRPDISHAVQQLAQAMQAPTQLDVLAAKRVFRYLAGTKDVGLVFGSRCGQVLDTRGRNAFRLEVCAYADADWANSKADRKSITGWVAKINGDPISWASKKQRTVAQSTCEAELYAEAAAIQEVLWLRGLLSELGLAVQTGSTVYGDNQSTIALSKNGVKGERTKHVDVKYYFITETVESGKVKLQWIPTKEQQADIFTKPLDKQVFELLRSLLMTR